MAERVLLTNHHLQYFAGSEIATFDLAKSFRGAGYDVTVATFVFEHPLKEYFDQEKIRVVNLLKEQLQDKKFDLVWAHHSPILNYLLFEENISAKKIIACMLSPFEPLEAPPIYANDLTMCLANSEETKKQLTVTGVAEENILVFLNSVTDDFFTNTRSTKNEKLQKIAVVGNYVTEEVKEASALLSKDGLTVDFYGFSGKIELITPRLLADYDAVVTIGRTVQYALALCIPVFCYGHFGGPGWINISNIDHAQYFNFSGRCTGNKRDGEKIYLEIRKYFQNTYKMRNELQNIARERYSLNKNVVNVLRIVKGKKEIRAEIFDKFAYTKAHNRYYIQALRLRRQKEYDNVELLKQRTTLEGELKRVAVSHSDCLREKDKQLAEKDLQLNEKDGQVADLQKQFAEQDRHLDVVLHTLSWRITAPLRWAYDKLVPFNTKRRLLITIISGAFSQPKQFLRNMSMSNLRNFIHYLKSVEPSLLEKGVKEVLAGKVEEATNEAIKYNNYLLEILEKKPEEGLLVPRKEQVDIILPIYNAYEYTRTCLESVLRNSSNCRLILINDASTDKMIKDLLDSVKGVSEKNLEVVVMHNEKNLGFVKTVNRAQKYTNNHFVILNSDTEVPPGWLDRLFMPIFADEKHIASVTPFSNAAEICSFPNICKNNEIPENLNVDSLDHFFAMYGSQTLIELPTGIGFCMAFNKYAVQKIGFYDEETFGRGYGEENDWSLRVSNSGFKNVMITNLFVYHKHGGTFDSAEKTRLLRENLAIIANKYPGYFEDVHSFIRNDQLRDLRDTLAVIIDTQTETNKRGIAIIDHDQGGGANIYSSLLVEKLRQTGDTILHFRFNNQRSYLDLRYTSEGVKKEFMFRAASVEKVVEIMKILGVDVVLINQIASWPNPLGIAEKLYASGLPYVVFAHDYFVVCPNWFLVNDHYRFCEIPEEGDICISCLDKNRYAEHKYVYGDSLNDELSWREVMHLFLLRAQKVICFSTSTMKYLMRTYGDLTNIEVIEHAIPDKNLFAWKQRQFDGRSQLNIAVIGSIGSSKGINIIQDLVHHPQFEKIAVNITVLGKTSLFPEGYVGSNGRLRIHGSYKREHLPALLEKYDISAVLIPSIWPETFSYTTSEALLLGYPVICFSLGAQAERVSKYDCGIVVTNVSAEGLIHAFEEILMKPKIIEIMSQNAMKYDPDTEEKHFEAVLEAVSSSLHSSG